MASEVDEYLPSEDNTTITTNKNDSFENWNKLFCETDLLDPIVGDNCIDWSNNTVAIATKKSALICEMGSLRKPVLGRPSNILFMMENVFLEDREETPVDVKLLQEIDYFAQARLKSSNTAAFPNYDAYKVILDPSIYETKTSSYKGFKNVQFSPYDEKFQRYLATLSLDYCCKLFCRKSNIYSGLQWVECADISKLLVFYITTQNDSFDDGSNLSLLNNALDKKCSSSITTLAWSNITSVSPEQDFVLLATATRNGFVVIWKIIPCDLTNPDINILHILKTELHDITSISFHDSNNTKFSLVIGGHNGQIYCYTFSQNQKNECEEINSNKIWNIKDRLAVRKLKWLFVDDNHSLIIACKSYVIVAFKLNNSLQVIDEAYISEGFHEVPIKDICFCKSDKEIKFYTCCDDGQIVATEINLNPKLTLTCLVFSESNEHKNTQSLQTFHGLKLSPNMVFMAIVTSKPKIVSSVQTESTGILSCKRIMSPNDAVSLLINAAEQNQNLCNYLDVFELLRHYYTMKGKHVDVLEEILAKETNLEDLMLVKLQLHWYLWKIKVLTIPPDVSRNTFASFGNEAKNEKHITTELSKVETCLLFRKMILILQKWWDSTKINKKQEPENLPINDIINWLKNKNFLLNDEHRAFLQEIESSGILASYPQFQTCLISSTRTQFDETGRFGVSENGSKWPLCCLTFRLIQTPAKRICKLSGLYASPYPTKQSQLINKLLNGRCIFSGSTLL